jgi:hypothetical protein
MRRFMPDFLNAVYHQRRVGSVPICIKSIIA